MKTFKEIYKAFKILICFILIITSIGCSKTNKAKEEIICNENDTLKENSINSIIINNTEVKLDKSYLCKADIRLNSNEKEAYLKAVSGDYEVQQFKEVKFIAASFIYDADYTTEYIKNKIEANKEAYKITMVDNKIIFQNQEKNTNDCSITYRPRNSNSNSNDPDISIYSDVLEGDFPVEILFKSTSDTIQVGILFSVDKYEEWNDLYQFLAIVEYKKKN